MATAIGELEARVPERIEQPGMRTMYRIPILDALTAGGAPAQTAPPVETAPQPAMIERTATPNMQPGGLVPRRVMPKRYVRVTLPDVYNDFHFTGWANVDVADFANRAQALISNVPDPNDAAIADDGTLDDAERASRAAERTRRTGLVEDAERAFAAQMGELIISHDFVDYNGDPLPPTDEMGFWRFVLANELGDIMLRCLMAERGNLNPTKRA